MVSSVSHENHRLTLTASKTGIFYNSVNNFVSFIEYSDPTLLSRIFLSTRFSFFKLKSLSYESDYINQPVARDEKSAKNHAASCIQTSRSREESTT